MSLNSSSSPNSSLLPPPHLPSSNSSLYPPSVLCFNYRSIFFIFISFSVTNVLLLLPICVLVIHLALQRWRKQRSGSTAAATSHSDIFTYHMVAMEMIGISGNTLYCCGACFNLPLVMIAGVYLFSATSNGQIFFHMLTCLERHLAVVHPINYLRLKNRNGVRIRNIILGCVWLFFVGSFGLISVPSNYSTVPAFCLSVLSILVVSFCSVSVLRALIRPGPGDGGKDKERVDQSKTRAFHTIVAIMGALLLTFGGYVLVLAVYASPALSEDIRCGVLVSGVWFRLPCSLVLPLLFLHRAGKLLCCQKNPESGQESE